MKSFIKRRIREVMIDDVDMNKGTETICNKMTIGSYQEAMHHVKKALQGKTKAEITDIMQKIHAPLENLKHEQIKIDSEVKNYGMSGDSMPDEADTYWAEIQTAFCDAGPDFQR
jgi:hypothetical protein